MCAIIVVRNEFNYLRLLLPYLQSQQIDVVIIDNDSNDNSTKLFDEFWQTPVISVNRLPFDGIFDQKKMLIAKQGIIDSISHDWIIHHDADEMMEHREKGYSLRDAIYQADQGGYNAINFEEFVFIPERNQDCTYSNYYEEILRYYFFSPKCNRLNRAWKRCDNLQNFLSGGHQLEGELLNVDPRNHILRHYITLSFEHAKAKYVGRKFAVDDLALGWHSNRVNIEEKDLMLPLNDKKLNYLDNFESKQFNRELPLKFHYWQWYKKLPFKQKFKKYIRNLPFKITI